MLKPGIKRRRSKIQIEQDREEEKQANEQVKRQAETIKQLEEKLNQKSEDFEYGKKASKVLSEMIEAGALIEQIDGSLTLASGVSKI